MADVIEFSSQGRRGGRTRTDPDEKLSRDGTVDAQTGRVKRDVAISNRSQAATNLRALGASYAEIAEELEYSSAIEARQVVEATLAGIIDESKDYMALRALEHLRLEGLYRSVAPKAMDETNPDQLGYHRAALSVLDRIAKLHGLDAPQRLEFVNPGAEEFEAVLSAMMHASPQGAIEPDIFELEAIDAEWEEGDRDPEEDG